MPCLIQKTIEVYKYDPTALPEGSAKPVLYSCDTCHQEGIKQRRRLTEETLCHKCAIKKPRPPAAIKKFEQTMIERYGTKHALQNKEIVYKMQLDNVACWRIKRSTPTVIIDAVPTKHTYKTKLSIPVNLNVEETFKQFGYQVTEDWPRKHAKIVCHCANCRILLIKKRQQATTPLLCKSCERKKYWATGYRPLYPIPSYISNELTLKEFGYTATSISPEQHQPVIVICSQCSDIFPRVRRNIRDPVLCHSCSKINMWAARHTEIEDKRQKTIIERYGASGIASQAQPYGAAENEVADFITTLQIPVLRQYPLDGRKTLDIVLPEHRVAIEYNGLFWHHEHSKTTRGRWFHYEKMQAAFKKGLRLYTIFEDEWLDRPNQVKALIQAKLNVNMQRVYARQCTIQSIDLSVAKHFINAYHLQKLDATPIAGWGLYYRYALIAVLTVRHDYSPTSLILNRLCFAPNTQIIGGANKLLAALIPWAKANNYSTIKTWSDNRWSDGNIYKIMNFTLVRDGNPDYAYVRIEKPTKRITKETQQKSRTNCPPNITEVEWALQRGLARIWDCGHKRWELQI